VSGLRWTALHLAHSIEALPCGPAHHWMTSTAWLRRHLACPAPIIIQVPCHPSALCRHPPQMVHCARFFYGPMLQGRDGIGAAPCCGTGGRACLLARFAHAEFVLPASFTLGPCFAASCFPPIHLAAFLGAGVVFRRDVLVSIGGQSYGSITEDYNTGGVLVYARGCNGL